MLTKFLIDCISERYKILARALKRKEQGRSKKMNKYKDKIRFEAQNNCISEDGEVVEFELTREHNVGKEPDFVKIYTQYVTDIGRFSNLTPVQQQVMTCLCLNMDYKNTVVVGKLTLPQLAFQANISPVTFLKSVKQLSKLNLLVKLASGVYVVNPQYAGKGRWEDIKALELTIKYNSEGRSVVIKKITPSKITISEVKPGLPL